MIKEIKKDDELLAMIIPGDYKAEGVQFFTPNSFSQQLAYMQHPEGKQIEPHLHNPVRRKISYTQEVLVIRKGKLRVDFYNKGQQYLESYILEAGDVILLVSGGHGFEVLEEIEMIEIKQGPFVGEQDKTRFTAVDKADVTLIN